MDCRLLPFTSVIIVDRLGCAELFDPVRATEGGNQEVVSLFRQLVDDVLHSRVRTRDDTHRLPLGNQRGNQIKDCLRLASPWRAVNN